MTYKLIIMVTTILLAITFSGCTKERRIDSPGTLLPKTVIQDPSLPSITINGAKLHAEAFGSPDSPLLIILHGGPGCDYRYLLNCKAFANEGYRVVFFDQRGAGLSERFPASTYDNLDVAIEDVKAVIAHYRTSPGQKVFILGHSWGAMLASAFINAYPAAAQGLILGEPGGLVWKDVVEYMDRSNAFSFFSEDLNNAVYFEQFLSGKEDEHEILDYKSLLWASSEEGSLIGNEGRVPFWRNGGVSQKAYFETGERVKPDWTANLYKFTTKVLFIYSQNNKAYGIEHAKKVSAAYPNVQLFQTNDAGHDMLTFPRGWNNTYPAMLDYLNALK